MPVEKIQEKEYKGHSAKDKDGGFKFEIKKARLWQFFALIIIIASILLFSKGSGILPGITGSVVSGAAKDDMQEQPSQELQEPERIHVSEDDDPVLGYENAPITMVSFEDYQCPFCGMAFQQTFPLIKKEYIDTGKVKYVYRDFPLISIHPEALPAAEAAECAHEQDKFWEYHNYLFQNQNQLRNELYIAIAKELKLDVGQFTQCMASDKYVGEIQNDFNAGVEAGVTGTPAFFINGIKLVGTHPFENFKKIIESELGNQG